MAGRGPAPKDPSARARRNKDPQALRVFTATPVEQPPLPPLFLPDEDGKRRRVAWPAATKRWWSTWGDEPMAADFRPTDWDFLLDTALIHAKVWGEGDLKLLPELRLRVAKMGATTEDRARLRIAYAAADEADEKRTRVKASSARERRGPLKAV